MNDTSPNQTEAETTRIRAEYQLAKMNHERGAHYARRPDCGDEGGSKESEDD